MTLRKGWVVDGDRVTGFAWAAASHIQRAGRKLWLVAAHLLGPGCALLCTSLVPMCFYFREKSIDRRFSGTYCLHHQGDQNPDNGGSTHLWNVGLLQPDYTALNTIRLSCSYSSPWEPEISQWKVTY
jgi:hypothetical protein